MGSFSLVPPSGGGNYERPPAGNHPAVCVAIVDMGTHTRGAFNGGEKDTHMVYLAWELVTQKQAASKNLNHLFGDWFTLSFHEKSKLTTVVAGRLGQKAVPAGYDIAQELGKPCLLNIVLSDKGHPTLGGVSAVPPGLPFPEPQHQPIGLALPTLLAGTLPPDWLPYLYGRPVIDHLRDSREFRKLNPPAPAPAAQPAGNPIPF